MLSETYCSRNQIMALNPVEQNFVKQFQMIFGLMISRSKREVIPRSRQTAKSYVVNVCFLYGFLKIARHFVDVSNV